MGIGRRAGGRWATPLPHFLAAALIAAGLGAATLPSVLSARAPAGAADIPRADASAFLDTLGVNVHMAYAWTAYRDDAAVVRALNELGIRHVRDVFIPWPAAAPKYERLAVEGFKVDLVIPVIDGRADVADFIARVKAFDAKFPGSIAAVEGPNEVNIWKVTFDGGNDIKNAGDLQRHLFARLRAEPSLSHIPMYNVTLAYTEAAQHRELGALQGATDYANMHAYIWYWGTPAEGLKYLLTFPKISAPDLPTVITETGYTTTLHDSYSGVDENTQAIFMLQTLLDAFLMKVSRTYVYELLDLDHDPSGADPQKHFGLYRHDGAPKPAALAIRNLTRALRDGDDGQMQEAAAVSVAGDAQLRRLLLTRRDGTRCLIIWVESPLIRKDSRTPRPARSQKVDIAFDRAQDVEILDLLGATQDGVQERKRHAQTRRISVEVAERPLMIRFGDHRP
jgi:hypothetical protein